MKFSNQEVAMDLDALCQPRLKSCLMLAQMVIARLMLAAMVIARLMLVPMVIACLMLALMVITMVIACLMIAPMVIGLLIPLIRYATEKIAFSHESIFYMEASDFAVKNIQNFYCDTRKQTDHA